MAIDLTEALGEERNSDEASYREWLSQELERSKPALIDFFETTIPEERSEP